MERLRRSQQLTTGLDVLVARRRAGLRQYELVQLLGISATMLCDLEHDRREVTDELALRIAKAICNG